MLIVLEAVEIKTFPPTEIIDGICRKNIKEPNGVIPLKVTIKQCQMVAYLNSA